MSIPKKIMTGSTVSTAIGRYISSTYIKDIKIMKRVYPTMEHAYHAIKLFMFTDVPIVAYKIPKLTIKEARSMVTKTGMKKVGIQHFDNVTWDNQKKEVFQYLWNKRMKSDTLFRAIITKAHRDGVKIMPMSKKDVFYTPVMNNKYKNKKTK